MELTRRERNELFETLDKNGVDPNYCELRRIQDSLRTVTEIKHVPTQSAFTLSVEPTRYVFQWVVVDGPDSGAENATGAWSQVLEQFGQWAEEVQYVADVPDFWVELRQVPEILAVAQAADASNEPFTTDERHEISIRIDLALDVALRENPELNDDQLAAIKQGVGEVKEATTRVGRKDWVVMVNGTLLGLIANGLVPSHVVQLVFNVLITGIGHMFGIGGPPPIISI